MDGLDINLLMLALYANAKQIPVGLTTHRDIENTTLYTFCPALENNETSNDDALAAAISYWNEALFSQMELNFDFINARYQPIYNEKNYYETTLLPFEKRLADDINLQNFLNDRDKIELKMTEYLSLKEPVMANNDYKELQINWLCERYAQHINKGSPVFHLDDDANVTKHLQSALEKKHQSKSVKPIFMDDESLLANPPFLALLEHIGVIEYAKQLMSQDNLTPDHPLLANSRAVLSAGLLLAQANYEKDETLEKINDIFSKLKDKDNNCFMITNDIFVAICQQRQPVRLIANNLLSLLF